MANSSNPRSSTDHPRQRAFVGVDFNGAAVAMLSMGNAGSAGRGKDASPPTFVVDNASVSGLRQQIAGKTRGQEIHYIAISLLFLVAGVAAVWFVQTVLDVEGDAILVALLVVPLVLYLTLSGSVREFGAGSLSVKLNEVSREPVVDSANAEHVVADPGPTFDPANPVGVKTNANQAQVLALTLGRQYEPDNVLAWLRNLADAAEVPLLIVRGDQGQVLAYMTYRSALDLLRRPDRAAQFTNLVEGGDPDVFDGGGGFSALRTETLSEKSTNAEALAAMEEAGFDTLVVVDRKGRFKGIVERDRVLSRMMLGLVTPHSTTSRTG
jgi:CBS domain-containing protein